MRTELVDLGERYDDLVLSRWILAQRYECALGRMNLHDPAGIVWLVEQLAEWERDVEAKRTKRLQEPARERARRRYEEESSGDSNSHGGRRTCRSTLHSTTDRIGDLAASVFGGLEVAEAGSARRVAHDCQDLAQ